MESTEEYFPQKLPQIFLFHKNDFQHFPKPRKKKNDFHKIKFFYTRFPITLYTANTIEKSLSTSRFSELLQIFNRHYYRYCYLSSFLILSKSEKRKVEILEMGKTGSTIHHAVERVALAVLLVLFLMARKEQQSSFWRLFLRQEKVSNGN